MRYGGQWHVVGSAAGEVSQHSGAVDCGEIGWQRFCDNLGYQREERVVRCVQLVVAAAGVIVAHRNVERNAGQRRAQGRNDGADCLYGKGEIVLVGGGGEQRLKLAVEGVGEQVAAERDEPGARGVGVDGAQAGLPQDIVGIEAARGAGLLQRGKLLRLRGRVGRGEDRGPFGGGRGVQPGGLRRVGEGVEVNVGEEECRNLRGRSGCGFARGRRLSDENNLRGQSAGGEQAEQAAAEGLHGDGLPIPCRVVGAIRRLRSGPA